MKKNKTIIATIMILILSLGMSQPVLAASGCQPCQEKIMGIPTWYRGLTELDDSTCQCEIKQVGSELSLKTLITTIIINIGDMMVRIIAIASLLFIVFGGLKYILSTGDDNKMAGAKKTVQRSVVGLVISLTSIGVMNFVFGLFGTLNNDVNFAGIKLNHQATEETLINNFLPSLFMWIGFAAVTMLIYGGAQYVMSAGNPNKVETAKKTISYSLIGVIIAALSFVIIKVVVGVLG